MIKRGLDLLFAGVGLLLLLPFMLVVAIAICLDSPGPVLFRQRRIGRNGRPFVIIKFRTMVNNADALGPRLTASADTRVTRLGGWLRRHKLDELPQLWNVLVGDMSLVGPRPEVPEYVALYPDEARRLILSVRPGITDPASVAFIDEASELGRHPDPERAYREVVLPQKIALYVDYVRNRTLLSDVRAVVDTLRAILSRPQRPEKKARTPSAT